MDSQIVNNTSGTQEKLAGQAGSAKAGQADKGIADFLAQDRRPVTQLGSNVDYIRVTRSVRNLIVGVVALVAVLVGLSLFVQVQEVARARGEFIPVERVQVIQTPEGGALSAILAFSDRVLYPSYAEAPRFFGLSPLEDQVAAGAFMWVAGSLAFILPAIVVAVRCLSTSAERRALSAA